MRPCKSTSANDICAWLRTRVAVDDDGETKHGRKKRKVESTKTHVFGIRVYLKLPDASNLCAPVKHFLRSLLVVRVRSRRNGWNYNRGCNWLLQQFIKTEQ